MPNRLINLLGQRFHMLAVLERADSAWRCRCDCGGETLVTTTCLKTGHTKSCGCLKRKKRSRPSLCECGEIKSKLAAQCDRCKKLDGWGSLQRWIISYLLETYEPVATPEISWWAGYELGASQRSVLRTLTDLKRAGRVEVISTWRDCQVGGYGHGGRAAQEVSAYRLVGVF